MSEVAISPEPPQSLDGLVQQAIRNAISASSLIEKVQKAADKAITDAVDSAFGYNSEFRNGLQKTVEAVLPVTKPDDLAIFAVAVREVIQRRLGALASDTAKAHMGEVLEKILPGKPVITMEELKKEYEDKLKDQISRDDCSCHEDDIELEYTWRVEKGDSSLGYWDLYMSPEEGASRYHGKDIVTLRFKPVDNKDPASLQECWHVSTGSGDKLVGSIFAGPMYGFDAMVFRLATGTAKLSM